MFDIDDFKGVNDKYGHQVGDEVLIKLTKEVKKTISKNDIIGRYGGEEVIVLLPNVDKNKAFNKEYVLIILRKHNHIKMSETILYIEIQFGKDAFMSGDECTLDKKGAGNLSINLSAGNNKIRYYECSGDNCVFEILDDESCCKQDNPKQCNCESDNKDMKHEASRETFNNGRISVKAIIDCGKQEILKGAKINLYKINGLSPILIKSKFTDENGEAIFSNVEDGSYRIIEIIDKEYFEKPKYINWNEITIDCNNKKEKILIVNKLKKYRSLSKHN